MTDMTLIRSGKKTKNKNRVAKQLADLQLWASFWDFSSWILRDYFATTHGVPGLKVLDFQHILHFSA